MAVNLPFNERKATEAAAHLLKLRGGRMSYMKLIMLLYLADREALLRFGCPITTDRYVTEGGLPLLSGVFYLINRDRRWSSGRKGIIPPSKSAVSSEWTSVILSPAFTKDVVLNTEIEPQELSDAEIELLDEIRGKHGELDERALVEITQSLPEFRHLPDRDVEISYRDILLHAGKTPAEIDLIEQELAALETGSYLEPAENDLRFRRLKR